MHPWVARHLVYHPATWLRGEPVFRILRRYERTQWWTPEQIQSLQARSLDRLLRHATRRSRFYADVARESGIDPTTVSARDLTRFPLLSKSELQASLDRIRTFRLPGTATWKTTGGSTGAAVRLRKNRWATAAEQAASWRSYRWYGIRPGDKQARFWGIPLDPTSRLRFKLIDLVLNRVRFSAFAFGPTDLAAYYAEIERTRPAWAYGYVSMLSQFATYCLEERLPLDSLGLRAVVTTSEVLSDPDRQRIEQAFGARVYNEYGCGEVGAILYECESGSLHAMSENLVLELAPDPTPDEPEAHRLIVTDLHNLATPLIRYDLRDRVVPASSCPCGRGLAAFRRVFGRAYDMIETRDGQRFHGEFFLYILEAARDRGLPIGQAQFVQVAPDHVEVRVIPLAGYRDEHGRFLSDAIEERTRGRLHASVVQRESIEREASGKIRLIKSL